MGAAQNDAVTMLSVRPATLLTQNSNLARDGIFNWSLPAWKGELPDGREYNTCPSAGVCRLGCYARNGSYRFRNVLNRHERNLAYVLDDLPGWTAQMIAEVEQMYQRRRKQGKRLAIRIHDSGDFFSDAYLRAWLEIAAKIPEVLFYCYTKEVARFRRIVEPNPLPNFKYVYSLGGKHDRRLDLRRDRVADVFPDTASLIAAGFHDQEASDLLAVEGPAPVGMAANNIRHFRKLQGDRSYGQWQAEEEAQQAELRQLRRDFEALGLPS